MNALAIFAFLLTVSRVSNFNLRGTGNDTLQQQQQKETEVNLRIFNGQPAAHTQFPYQVGLRKYITHTRYQLCGGSLISPNWVLTAANCVVSGIKVAIFFGIVDFGPYYVEIPINSHDIIRHEDYNETTYKHDIAVIKIPTVSLSREIDPLKLPGYDGTLPSYFDAKAVVTGWGRTSDSDTNFSSELQYTTLTVIRNKKCADHFGASYIYKGKLCTKDRGSSACFGDSGNPLVYTDKHSKRIQIGILSFVDVVGCERGHPNAFTRVSDYLEWISLNTRLQD